MDVHHMLTWCPRSEEGVRTTGTETTDRFEVDLESNPGSLEEQWVLLSMAISSILQH